MHPSISIIIRARNEERWIVRCLERIKDQTMNHVEVILVDNCSTDKTIDRARHIWPEIKVLNIDHFTPGLALNLGMNSSSGRYVVCLSAHCPPARNDWLEKLLCNFENPSVAGVYGRQIPTRFTEPQDRRDLLYTFGLERRIHHKDPFFHNANSMIRRDIWESFPFNPTVSNIEDRLWAKKVLEAGYTVVYEPEAPVYHHHGIHLNNDLDRCRGVVSVLQTISEENDLLQPECDPSSMNIIAVIPQRHGYNGTADTNPGLLKETIADIHRSRHIKKIVVAADRRTMVDAALELGADLGILRPEKLSLSGVRVDAVLAFTLEKLEKDHIFPDVVVSLDVTHPFRPEGLLDGLVEKLVTEGFDSVLAGIPETRPCWFQTNGLNNELTPPKTVRSDRKPLQLGLPSLGCATYPEVIRRGSRFEGRLGLYEVNSPLAGLEIRSQSELKKLEELVLRLGQFGTK
jgi:glycosyltransferase involved in cell wall biosynthesis